MVTEFILIRHGQSIGNLNNLYLGHTDLSLSELGLKQASICAEHFSDYDISAIYSSDLIRAAETAKAHARLHNLKVITSKDLREIHVGLWEGRPISELTEKWPFEFTVEWRQKYGTSIPPEGEPVLAAAKRFNDKLISIAKECDGRVLVVAHGAVLRGFWCYINGILPASWAEFVPFPSNASATFVRFDGEKLCPVKFSFDDYLADCITNLEA